MAISVIGGGLLARLSDKLEDDDTGPLGELIARTRGEPVPPNECVDVLEATLERLKPSSRHPRDAAQLAMDSLPPQNQ